MTRNLLKRVEECYPIEEPALKTRVIEQGLKLYLQDNTHAWVLDKEGHYTRLIPKDDEPAISAQQTLLEQLAEKA